MDKKFINLGNTKLKNKNLNQTKPYSDKRCRYL